jgi:hypothetical protein
MHLLRRVGTMYSRWSVASSRKQYLCLWRWSSRPARSSLQRKLDISCLQRIEPLKPTSRSILVSQRTSHSTRTALHGCMKREPLSKRGLTTHGLCMTRGDVILTGSSLTTAVSFVTGAKLLGLAIDLGVRNISLRVAGRPVSSPLGINRVLIR